MKGETIRNVRAYVVDDH